MSQQEIQAYKSLSFVDRCKFWQDNPQALDEAIVRWKKKQEDAMKCGEDGEAKDG